MPYSHSRRYPRIKLDGGVAIKCRTGGHAYRATVFEMGAGGLFIGTPTPMLNDREMHIQFRPGKGLHAVDADVRVRYQLESEGNGVEFTKIPSQGREDILKMILQRLRSGGPVSSGRFVAQVEHPEGMFLGFATPFGEDGLLVETKSPIASGSVVSVRYRTEEDGPLIVAAGKVVYAVEKFGIGVFFGQADVPWRALQ